jgi:putative spermidine/putrescine transport system permease protein
MNSSSIATNGIAPGRLNAEPHVVAQMRRDKRLREFKALALVAPLLLFLLVMFVAPVALLLTKSVDNRDVAAVLQQTARAMRQWDGNGTPGEAVFAALAADLKGGAREDIASLARTLNQYQPGFRSLMIRTARAVKEAETGPYQPKILQAEPAWADIETWHALARALPSYTDYYLLASLDLRRDASDRIASDRIASVDAGTAVYADVILRTFHISFLVTVGCLLLGYPLAYFIAASRPRSARILLLLVLVPFWTSLLVRTAAWAVILQGEGIVNSLMVWLGMVDPAHPLPLIYNRTGVLIAMIHILLPFMVLPLYGAMKDIPPNYMRAASSLGASPLRAFFRVFLPLTMPGVGAGCLLVFILALGYYITPSLIGGARDQMLSYYIAYFTDQVTNWGMAAALSAILLTLVLVLYWIYNRIVGLDKLRIG